jgi:large subunit ribosomal protein L29
MKPAKLREMATAELEVEESKLRDEIFRLRLKKATGQLDSAGKIRTLRRDLARVATLLGERRRAEAPAGGRG